MLLSQSNCRGYYKVRNYFGHWKTKLLGCHRVFRLPEVLGYTSGNRQTVYKRHRADLSESNSENLSYRMEESRGQWSLADNADIRNKALAIKLECCNMRE